MRVVKVTTVPSPTSCSILFTSCACAEVLYLSFYLFIFDQNCIQRETGSATVFNHFKYSLPLGCLTPSKGSSCSLPPSFSSRKPEP